ncbi:LysE family translocator [Ottowia testudinis]|uniref:LysE family transporter n=1 Tax=Ottowia testudinis TaxID=2816950 RepID=A0A975CJQ4_9BURK|nr:LysE family transporter [Ottowia testudinis]QTD47091.1 LysE family transporter [Ottowia testudinis]
MLELIAVATITLLAVISPGADFAMVTRNSLLHGRAAGLLCALGIAVGVLLHVAYAMLGVGLLLRQSPQWMAAVRLLGAAYLVYVGWQTFHASAAAPPADEGSEGLSPWRAFRSGFFTNALNPKTTLFVLSVYAQVVNALTPLAIRLGYGAFMSLAHLLWFAGVATVLSQPRLRQRLLACQSVLNRGIGMVLAGLGVWLALG